MRADTIDAPDERLTGAHIASEQAGRDLEPTETQKARGKAAKAKKASPVAGTKARTWRIRLTLSWQEPVSDAEAREVVQDALKRFKARVTRCREVTE